MRLYALLLALYPSSFRAEYGGEMRAIFEERWSRASGAGERLRLLLSAAADVLPNALRVHAGFLAQDARYTLRMLARSPGFAAGQGVLLAGLGALLGAGLAYAGGRAIQSLLAGVSPADVPTFLAAAGLALAMTLLGSLFPALRAARLDPAQVIRSE